MKEYQVPILIKTTEPIWANTWEEAVKKMASCSSYLVDYQAIDAIQKSKIFPQRELTFSHWVEKYKPLKNPLTFFRNRLNVLTHFEERVFYHYLHGTDYEPLEMEPILPDEVIWTLINVDPCIDYMEIDKEFRILSGLYPIDMDFPNGSTADGYFLTEKGVSPNKAYQIIIGG